MLSVLKAWLGWMEARNQLSSNVDIFLNLLLPLLHEGDKVPVQVYSAASQLFLELARRPNYLCPLRNRAVADFIIKASYFYDAKLQTEPRFWQVPKLKLGSPETVNCIYSAICEILLKPLKSLNQQTLQAYKRFIDGFLKDLSADFVSLTPKTAEGKVIETVHVLPALAHLIEYCRCYPLVSKKELAIGIEVIIKSSRYLVQDCQMLVLDYLIQTLMFMIIDITCNLIDFSPY